MSEKQISHYRIVERLGGSSMGVVYRAEDEHDGKTVALKLLPFELAEDPEAKDSFVREAAATSALEHENLCTVYETGETADGRLFAAMAFYDGETLKNIFQRTPLDVDHALDLARQIARGLEACHRADVVHRDLQPANVMVDADGTVKLLDFGLAPKLSDSGLTQMGSTLGNPAYMSPERARGEAVDERTDLWSLGVLIYKAISGVSPFQGDHLPGTIQNVCNKQPQPLDERVDDLPAGLSVLVERLLAKRPSARPATASDVLAELEALGSGIEDAPAADDQPHDNAQPAQPIDATDHDVAAAQKLEIDTEIADTGKPLPTWMVGLAVVLLILTLIAVYLRFF